MGTLTRLHIFGVGLAIGVASFLIAMMFVQIGTRGEMLDLSAHDLQLANNLGFIFPPFIGFWSGIFRRSLLWTFIGVGVGLGIGSLYRLFCGYDFMAVMVAYPTLLGGVVAAALGRRGGASDWVHDIVIRFLKGLVAGFVLGLLYMVVLNVLAMFLLPPFEPRVLHYRRMMWIAGTFAMGLASGCYLVLFHWSAQLEIKRPTA